MIKNYFKIAWRNLLRNKASSFINIGGLSIGMAVALLISLWINDELSYDKNFANYNMPPSIYPLRTMIILFSFLYFPI